MKLLKFNTKMHENEPGFHWKIIMSDEAHFHLEGYVNQQNCRIWGSQNPKMIIEKPLYPQRVTAQKKSVYLPDWLPCHLVCHFSTSLRLPSLRMASFARAISCRLVKQVSSLRSWKVSFLSPANKSIGGTLARTSTALVDTVRYAETFSAPHLSVPRPASSE